MPLREKSGAASPIFNRCASAGSSASRSTPLPPLDRARPEAVGGYGASDARRISDASDCRIMVGRRYERSRGVRQRVAELLHEYRHDGVGIVRLIRDGQGFDRQVAVVPRIAHDPDELREVDRDVALGAEAALLD